MNRPREKKHKRAKAARLMAVYGTCQRHQGVCNLVGGHLEGLTPLLGMAAGGEPGLSIALWRHP